MPFIDNEKQKIVRCQHPEHNPPSMIVLPAGVHIWQCPHCGEKQRFFTMRSTCSMASGV